MMSKGIDMPMSLLKHESEPEEYGKEILWMHIENAEWTLYETVHIENQKCFQNWLKETKPQYYNKKVVEHNVL